MSQILTLIAATVGVPLPLSSPSLAPLQLDAVLNLVASRARTAPGHSLCCNPPLATSAAECAANYAPVQEALALAASRSTPPPFTHSLDVFQLVEDATTQTLDAASLGALGDACDALDALAKWSASDDGRRTALAPTLASSAAAAAPPPRLLDALQSCTEPASDGDGSQLSSTKFPLLGRLRKKASTARRSVDGRMKSLLVEKKSSGEVPKDATSLSRDGRPVLAVAPSIKHAVGVEVGASRSGATVYVEPHELLPLTAAQRSICLPHVPASVATPSSSTPTHQRFADA